MGDQERLDDDEGGGREPQRSRDDDVDPRRSGVAQQAGVEWSHPAHCASCGTEVRGRRGRAAWDVGPCPGPGRWHDCPVCGRFGVTTAHLVGSGGTTPDLVAGPATTVCLVGASVARLPTWWLVLPRLPAWCALRWHDYLLGGWSCHDCLLGGHFGGTTTHLVGGTWTGQRASRVRSGRDLRIRKASEWVPVSGLHVMGSCGTSLPQLPIRWPVLSRLSTRSALRWHDHLLGRSSIGTAAYRAGRRPAPLPPQEVRPARSPTCRRVDGPRQMSSVLTAEGPTPGNGGGALGGAVRAQPARKFEPRRIRLGSRPALASTSAVETRLRKTQ